MNFLIYIPMMVVVLHHPKCAAQNASFWEQLGIRLSSKGEPPETKYMVHYPSKHNIENFKVTILNGYSLGTSMIALASVGTLAAPKFPQSDMRSADFFTNAYRWALRALSLITEWAAGKGGNYADSQKVWLKRYHYMDAQVPSWLRSILFFVDDWEREDWAKERYTLYAKPAFDKHLRFPSKIATDYFDFFRQTQETVENLDDSEAETPTLRSMHWGPALSRYYNEDQLSDLEKFRIWLGMHCEGC